MARLSSILIPKGPVTKVSPTTGASSAEIDIGKHQIFAISGDVAFHVAFGRTGMAAATAGNFLFAGSGTVHVLDTGSEFTHIRIFNPDAATKNFYVLPLSVV